MTTDLGKFYSLIQEIVFFLGKRSQHRTLIPIDQTGKRYFMTEEAESKCLRQNKYVSGWTAFTASGNRRCSPSQVGIDRQTASASLGKAQSFCRNDQVQNNKEYKKSVTYHRTLRKQLRLGQKETCQATQMTGTVACLTFLIALSN